jgi:hypothetical protein
MGPKLAVRSASSPVGEAGGRSADGRGGHGNRDALGDVVGELVATPRDRGDLVGCQAGLRRMRALGDQVVDQGPRRRGLRRGLRGRRGRQQHEEQAGERGPDEADDRTGGLRGDTHG